MIDAWHLLWLIPISVMCGYSLAIWLEGSKDGDDHIIDNSDHHMICRYSGEPCSKEQLDIYEDNCGECADKPFDGTFPEWCEEERKRQ